MSRVTQSLRLAGAALLALSFAPAQAAPTDFPAGDFAVTGATVVRGDGSAPIPGGTVVVRGGKVVAAGAGVAVPAGVPVVDGSGTWVTAGIVAPVTDLGLLDVNGVEESNSSAGGKTPFGAGLDIAGAIDPEAMPLRVSRTAGVTRSAVTAVADQVIFAGQGALISLGANGRTVDKPRAFQFVELGERGARIAGGSRLGAQAYLHNALAEARDLARRAAGTRVTAGPNPAEASAARATDALLNRADAAALIPVVNGTQPLFAHVERVADIRFALGLRREFPQLKLVVVGAAEGWRVADELAAAKVPVIASALTDLPGRFETLAATQSNIGRMVRAGVKVGIGVMFDGDQPRYARQFAGNLVAVSRIPGATGLTWTQAFAAISSAPAEILGEGAHYGSLLPGHAADVVIWDGDPLELSTAPLAVYIDGAKQSLTDHQTRLRERYRKPGEGALPKPYEW